MRHTRYLLHIGHGEAEVPVQSRILRCNRCIEHGGVIGIRSDEQALLEVGPDRVLGDRWANSGPHIAQDAHLQGNLPFPERGQKTWVLACPGTMADPLNLELVYRSPDGLGAGRFTCMGSQSEAVLGRALINGFVGIGREALFAPTQSVL